METEQKVENEKKEVENQAPVQQQSAPTPLGVPVKTIALIVLLAFIAAVLLYIALTPKKTNTATRVVQVEQSQENTVLSLSNTQKNANGTYFSDVLIDTGKDKLNAVQLELSFDPKALTNVDISAGNFLPQATELIKKVDPVNGTISYAISLPFGQSPVSGKGVIAKITYSPVSSSLDTSTTINFLPKTEVSSLSTGLSVLKQTVGGIVQIQAAQTSTSSAQ